MSQTDQSRRLLSRLTRAAAPVVLVAALGGGAAIAAAPAAIAEPCDSRSACSVGSGKISSSDQDARSSASATAHHKAPR